MRLLLDADGRPAIDWADPELMLTDAQRAAMATDREIVLTAGAGAGKTHTLALRWVGLLLQRVLAGEPDVESVLVLTFTERAAAEMAERCTLRLAALCRAARELAPELDARDPDGRAGRQLATELEGLLDRIDRARIGTFHGFCASLLREYPAECRTPPGARVLEPAEAAALHARVLDDALHTLVREDDEALPLLLDAFGTRRQLLAAGREALVRRGVLAPLLQAHADGALGLAEALDEAPISPADAHAFATGAGLRALQAVVRLTAPSGGGPFVDDRLRPLVTELRVPLPEPTDIPSTLAAYDRYRRILEALLTDQDTLRTLSHHTVVGAKATWPDQRRYTLAKQALSALQEQLSDWPDRAEAARRLPTPADEALYAALRPFATWVLRAADALRATLDEQRAVTFDAMQLRAVRAVLDTPALRQTLRQRFRYLMVDEFQDTDALQWSLVQALARDDPAVPEDRVFLVGDVKQAIYGFRGGDVTMFRAATEALGATPLRLPDNFRSRPGLIHWFNDTFPAVLGSPRPDLPAWEAAYEPLQPGRPEDGGEVLVVQDTTDVQGDDWQPRVVSRWLARELQPGSPWLDREAHPTPPIAILLRARTHLDGWEHALSDAGVPYVVGQGVAFWQRPEVLDLVNALSALAHDDERSWVGLLRSPLVGLTDRTVQDLRDGHLGPDGLVGFGRHPIPGEQHPFVHDAARRVARWRRLARVRPVTALLAELLDDLRPALWRRDPTGQAEANARRLISMAATFDARGPEGLHEAADHLLGQVEAGTREPEATLIPTEARVLVLTVHASKGLEFPVVIVPELHRRPRPSVEPLVVRRGGPDATWRMATRVMDPTAEVQTRVKPGLLSTLEQLRAREEDAEYRRLLYVAVTRARDRVVLVTETPPASEPGARRTWGQLVLENLPRGTTVLSADDFGGTDAVARPPAPLPPPPTDDDRARLAPVPVAPALELPASSLDLFAACPARWYRRVLLGVPEATPDPVQRARTLAGLRGQVLHQVLEDELEDDATRLAARWTALARPVGADDDELRTGLEVLTAHLEATRDSAHVARSLAAPGMAEVPVRRTAAGVTLRGRIDRLWRDEDRWVVLDWKSEAVSGDGTDAAARHRRQLLAYAWAADPILVGQGQPGVQRVEVVFTATGEVVTAGVLDDAARDEVEGLLEQVAEAAEQPWATVRDAAVASAVERPCASCGYRGRGCPGQAPADPQLSLL